MPLPFLAVAQNKRNFPVSQERSQSANRLLSALPATEYERLEPYLTSVSVARGVILHEASEKIETVYFPKTALVSLVNTLRDGTVTEVGIIGGTGVIGLPVILSNSYSNQRAIVQIEGRCRSFGRYRLRMLRAIS